MILSNSIDTTQSMTKTNKYTFELIHFSRDSKQRIEVLSDKADAL